MGLADWEIRTGVTIRVSFRLFHRVVGQSRGLIKHNIIDRAHVQ